MASRAGPNNTPAKALACASSCMTRVLRLMLLAPDSFEAILGNAHGPELTPGRVLRLLPVEWDEQHDHFYQTRTPWAAR